MPDTPTTPPLPPVRDLAAELVDRGDGWHVSPELMPSTTRTALPDQPDRIDDDSRDLPHPQRAARRVRAYITAFGDGLIDSADPGDGHPRPLYARDLEALRRAAERLADAESERDRYREHSITLNTVTWKIAEALGDVPPGADQIIGDPIERADRIVRELADARAERNAADRDLAHARRELEATRSTLADLQLERRLLGARRMRRAVAHQRLHLAHQRLHLAHAGTAPVPAPRAPETLVCGCGTAPDGALWASGCSPSCMTPEPTPDRGPADQVTDAMAAGAAAALAPPEGEREGGDDHGPHGAAQTIAPWQYTDDEGDTLTAQSGPQIRPAIAVSAAWAESSEDVTISLPPAAAASLHAWLGQHLGTAAPSTPGRPQPGPQDIPDEWLDALTRAAMDIGLGGYETVRHAVRTGYRLGYASRNGNEITISPEGDAVHIGDRCPDREEAAMGDK